MPTLKLSRQKPHPARQYALLESWFDTDRGGRLLAAETELVSESLSQAFGYFLLQLSVDSRASLYGDCRVQRKYTAHPFSKQADVQCTAEYLPFANESVDAVILHHVQEFSEDPYQLLREVQRVVVPHGQVVIVGFNPLSPLGVYTGLHRFFPHSHWHNRLINCWRMHDWLGLLGFEAETTLFGSSPSCGNHWYCSPRLEALRRQWPFGSFYVISAIKQVVGFTPHKQKWLPGEAGFNPLGTFKPPVAGIRQHRQPGLIGDIIAPPSLPRRRDAA